MSNVLKRPARRKKLKQREETDEEQENRFVDQFQQIKKRRVERKENVKTINMVSIYSIEILFTDAGTDNYYQLFDKLNQSRQELEKEGHYGTSKKTKEERVAPTVEKIKFDDDYMLDSDHSSDEEESTMLNAAKLYLDEEAQENIQTAIDESKNVEVVESQDCWNQEFFKLGTKVYILLLHDAKNK